MKALSDLFWGFLGLLLIVACFQACGDLAADPNWAAAADDPQPAAKADCQQPIIRVAAPYDLSEALADAEALTQGAVRFEQVASGQDVTIHDARLAQSIWGKAAYRGREVWLDFDRIPAPWLGRIALHEILHNAGFDNLGAGSCDIMATPPHWCEGRPLVRAEYVRGLQRLGRCNQEQPSAIQATAAPAQIVTDYAPKEAE